MSEGTSFGQWLRQRRHILDLTQQELADQVGCARITLRRIEAGALKPSKELAQILLEKLGMPPTELAPWLRFARGLSGFPGGSADSIASKPLTNLPATLTTFIGREKEQLEIIQLIGKYRLVTLVGTGGIGKTRLALKIAEQALRDYPHGIWLVELAPLLDPSLIPQTTTIAMGLREDIQHSVIDMLSDYLREKKMLILLDNCEHVLDACAQFVDTLLKGCPSLKILATSREALGIMGEATYRVPSLGLPDFQQSFEDLSDHESVRLFEERAQLAKMDFLLTEENVSAVAQICRQLDGIPLAIELAAARIKIFTPEQIAERLKDQFKLLTGGSRTALPRHQTIRASIDWSWNLLSDTERILLRRLSVFAGGWTLAAAEFVCSENSIQTDQVLDLITQLVTKSLIVVNEPQGQEKRYELLETIGQYAREKLEDSAETEITMQRHIDFFLRLAEEAELKLHGPQEIEWLNRLEMESGNLRVALEWTIANDPEAGLKLSSSLYWFWAVRTFWNEGRMWLTRLLGLPNLSSRSVVRARALTSAGFLAWAQLDLSAARSFFVESLAIYKELEHRKGVAQALHGLGRIARIQSEYAAAREFYEESLAIFRELGEKHNIADTLLSLGTATYYQGNFALASLQLEESLMIWQELGDVSGIAPTLNYLGKVRQLQGDYDEAGKLYEESHALFQKLGDKFGCIYTLQSLGHVAHHQGDTIRAAFLFGESLKLSNRWADLRGQINSLRGLAGVAAATGNLVRATKLFGAADRLLPTIDTRLDLDNQSEYDHFLAIVQTQLDRETFTEYYNQGRGMPAEEAFDYALSGN